MHPQMTDTELYDAGFYDKSESFSISSAEVIVPLVMRLVEPDSVLDVVVAAGAWLKIFERVVETGGSGHVELPLLGSHSSNHLWEDLRTRFQCSVWSLSTLPVGVA